MSRSKINRNRLTLVQMAALAMFVGAGFTQARVQLFGRDDILEKARLSKRFVVTKIDPARRGEIVSADGEKLAIAEGNRIMVLDYEGVRNSPGFFMALAAASGVPATEMSAFVGTKKKVEWELHGGSAQAEAVLQVKKDWRVDGLGIRRSDDRVYPMGSMLAGLVGTMNQRDPICGLELTQNALLTGIAGRQVGVTDKQGQFLTVRNDRESVEKLDGQTIELTVRTDLQRKAFRVLQDAVRANRADQGAAIVIVPETGDILAMASYPSFDPNAPMPVTKPGERSPAFTTSYQAALEPGSTFKILTLAKALDEGVVGPHTIINCPGTITVGKKLVRCDAHGGNRAHGALEPTEAIARSCNISAANWAMRVGHEKMVPYIEDLGLLRRPNLGLPREARGLFDYNEVAKKLQTANLGFGQSINVTPVSLAGAFAMLGNEGRAVHPRLIRKVGGKELPVEGGDQLVRPETAKWMLTCMRSVIESEHGTGKGLRIAGFEMGGKTGTAQKRNSRDGSMLKGGYVSNFVGYLPAEKPEAVILVMIDNPKAGKIYGAQVAGPVFLEIAKATINSLGLMGAQPDRRATNEPSDATPQNQTVAQSGPRIEFTARRVPAWTESAPVTLAPQEKTEEAAPTRTARRETKHEEVGLDLMGSLMETPQPRRARTSTKEKVPVKEATRSTKTRSEETTKDSKPAARVAEKKSTSKKPTRVASKTKSKPKAGMDLMGDLMDFKPKAKSKRTTSRIEAPKVLKSSERRVAMREKKEEIVPPARTTKAERTKGAGRRKQ